MEQKNTKRKFNNITDVACAIGLNYSALKLLRHLADTKNYKLALDYDFIMNRANEAEDAYDAVLADVDGYDPAWSAYLQEARYQRNQVLMAGL
jgi:hypothetical protein